MGPECGMGSALTIWASLYDHKGTIRRVCHSRNRQCIPGRWLQPGSPKVPAGALPGGLAWDTHPGLTRDTHPPGTPTGPPGGVGVPKSS